MSGPSTIACNVTTARLALRPLRADDAGRIFALFANPSVLRWLTTPPAPYRREHADEFVALRRAAGPEAISAAIACGDSLIGMIDVSVKPATGHQRGSGYAMGYWLGQPYWGRGYMSEAARAFLAFVFAVTGTDRIYSGALSGNAASLRIQEKLGFLRVADNTIYSNPLGREVPHVSTELARADFKPA